MAENYSHETQLIYIITYSLIIKKIKNTCFTYLKNNIIIIQLFIFLLNCYYRTNNFIFVSLHNKFQRSNIELFLNSYILLIY
jgi:hypothetical protein